MSASKEQYVFRIFILFYACLYVTDAQGCQDVAFPDSVHFRETDAIGTILFRSNESVSSTDKEWGVKTQFSGINVTIVNSSYLLVTSKIFDLDVRVPNCLVPKQQELELECDGNMKSIAVHIEPVNEFEVSFDTSLLRNLVVYENETIGYRLLSLLQTIIDEDCYSTYWIELISYPSNEIDGREFISLNNSDWSLYLKKTFDTDRMKCDFRILNRTIRVQITDGKNTDHELVKTVDVDVVLGDVDDQPPVFMASDQSMACEGRRIKHYSASVDFTEEGILKVSPSEIKAIDSDTSSPVITYEIVDSWPQRYADNIDINQQDATVIVRTPFSNLTSMLNETIAENIEITFILRATENKTNQVSVNTTLTITVLPPETTTVQSTTEQITTDTETSTEPETTSMTTSYITSTTPLQKISPSIHSTATPSQKTDILDILVIVLPVAAGVLLLVLIAVGVTRYRVSQRRNSKYPVGKGNSSIREKYKTENGDTQSFRASTNYAEIVTAENPVFTTEESDKTENR